MIDLRESRYDRQERIRWWDQSRLASARVLVVGAGALGNEIVKNLALVGVGHIDIVDMDVIEHSNLARCALFSDADTGRFKAEALADAVPRINPHVMVRSFTCRVQQLGSAWLLPYDVVIAGLDSREARLWVNTSCRRLGKYWIDGAIEGLQGLARVFGPTGACYECTLGPTDLASLSHRRSCALLSPEELASGKTPTNATTASVVAGIEVQEAIKLLVGRADLLALEGRVWRLEGETMMTSVMEYVEDPLCLAHEEPLQSIDAPTGYASIADIVTHVSHRQGDSVDAIYFPDDVLLVGACNDCGAGDEILGLRPLLDPGAGRCGNCSAERPIETMTAIAVDDRLVTVPWDQWLWPRQEFVTVRSPSGHVSIVLENHHG